MGLSPFGTCITTDTTVLFRPKVQSRVRRRKKLLADGLRLKIEVHREAEGVEIS